MTRPVILETERLTLTPFNTERHLTERYVAWLSDPDVVRYSEQRHRTHTLASCRHFAEGKCHAIYAGKKCKFAHPGAPGAVACAYGAECKYIGTCKYSHGECYHIRKREEHYPSIRRRRKRKIFDSTLGYPGEGPVSTV